MRDAKIKLESLIRVLKHLLGILHFCYTYSVSIQTIILIIPPFGTVGSELGSAPFGQLWCGRHKCSGSLHKPYLLWETLQGLVN